MCSYRLAELAPPFAFARAESGSACPESASPARTDGKQSPKAQISGGRAVPRLRDQRVEPPSYHYGVPRDNAFHPRNRKGGSASLKTMVNPTCAPTAYHYGLGRGWGVGRARGLALGVEVGVAVGVAVGVTVGVTVGVGVTVAVGVGVGVASDCSGA